ncbi:potassium channel family protein [Nocardiopsis dassonvillei]|uniref:potassium channel family protein n=1 Tax=Nocardiopsis dassonvillei TaxID=2014 RepID=UPI0020A522EC|nr:potassium channel family protein [Nocardiopsis dassonvillei]MCP3013259.1 potassium channel family protein [Nocardiopsis dassonvillei]
MRRAGGGPGRPVRLGVFLGFVVLLQFGYPVTLHGPVWTGLYLVAYVGVVLSGVVLVRGAHDRIAPTAATGAALLCCAAWAGATGGGGASLVSMFAAGAAFQLALMYSLLRFVYRRSRTHELEIVLAAVCVYLLLGGLFTTVFGALESLRPGSFADSAHPEGRVTWQQFVYFSYVTLATTGYGDVVPVSAWARSLSAAEGVVGTLFLTTVVARLVGAFTGLRREEGGAVTG